MRGRYTLIYIQIPIGILVQSSLITGGHRQELIYKGEGFLCKICGHLEHTVLLCPTSKVLTREEADKPLVKDPLSLVLKDPKRDWQTISFSIKRKNWRNPTRRAMRAEIPGKLFPQTSPTEDHNGGTDNRPHQVTFQCWSRCWASEKPEASGCLGKPFFPSQNIIGLSTNYKYHQNLKRQPSARNKALPNTSLDLNLKGPTKKGRVNDPVNPLRPHTNLISTSFPFYKNNKMNSPHLGTHRSQLIQDTQVLGATLPP